MLLTTLLRRIMPSWGSPRRPCRTRLSVEPLEDRNLLSGGPPINVNTDSEGLFHNETTIAVNPTNPLNMIGSANDYQGVVHGNGEIFYTTLAHAHVTFDGGHTWAEYPIPFHGYNNCGDPSVSFDADGTAYLATYGAVHSQNFEHSAEHSTAPDLVVSRSTDDGRTWSDPVRVATGAGTAFDEKGTVNDKPFLTAWGHGNAIITWTQFHFGPGGNEIDQPIFASVTHDNGNTWTDPVQISGPRFSDQYSVPTVAADGSIYVAFVNFGDNGEAAFQTRTFYEVVKVDPLTGQALGAPVDVSLMYDGANDYPRNLSGDITFQDSQFRSFPFGNITADPTNALHLAVVWSDMRNNSYPGGVLPSLDPYQVQTNSDIIVSQSFDGGVHWSAAAAIPTPNDQFQPFGAYDASGRLQIGYYDRSYDAANHKYGYTLASETIPGSLNFTEQQMTTALSDPTQGDAFPSVVTANSNFPNATTFLGDYSAIAVTPTGVAALWTDMRVPAPGFPGTSEDAFFAVVDDESHISITDVTKAESNSGQTTLFTFTVTLSNAYNQPTTVSYQTVNGIATTNDNDYVAKTGTRLAPGAITKTITIEVNGNSKKEASETFYLDLFGPSSNAPFTKNRGAGTP